MGIIGKITLRECKRIWKLPVFYVVMLILPVVVFSFYGLIYKAGETKQLAFAIWDEDNSTISRQLIFLLQQRDALHVQQQRAHNEQEIKDLMLQNKVYGAVHFPKDMAAQLYSKKSVTVTIYANATYLVPSKMIYKAVAEVILTANAGVNLQKLTKQGMPEGQAMAIANPIQLTTYQLYNPNYDYQEYLVPGLITVGMQMVLIISSMLALNYERKTGSLPALKALAHGSASHIIAGKLLAHLLFAWVNFVLIAFVLFPIFQIGVFAATGKFFVLYTLFALACFAVGFFISALLRDVMLAGDTALFYTSPSFVFSGYTFPRWALPWYDQFYAQIMPYTPFLDGFISTYFMELPLYHAAEAMGKLALFCVVLIPTAIILFQRQLNALAHETA
ncbi:ABC transporter permease [Olivibacter sitiensis]|uniref:ABC transporter permease n=1 Tax=Olivibacter sitiensis TaxID=376470 RepID=UPI0004808FB5|nr:ABC transporter permease [Olivibacter sitiensis]